MVWNQDQLVAARINEFRLRAPSTRGLLSFNCVLIHLAKRGKFLLIAGNLLAIGIIAIAVAAEHGIERIAALCVIDHALLEIAVPFERRLCLATWLLSRSLLRFGT